ncbi:mammalian ependymin-related protein 1-like [Antedon mediterranea]|uniref:mammalian ependymin-related protein 1-like n=1 Tax=Antedon mediterranea TaxID=105859 RepID=UPI003AF7D100
MRACLALCLLFFATNVKSQALAPCDAPDFLEAKIIEVNRERQYEVRSRLSYDARNYRKRYVDEVFTTDDTREYFDVLYLHNVGIEYRLDLQTRQCESRDISQEQFFPIGIPKNATFYGEATIGTKGFPGEGVLVQTWGGQSERGRYSGIWTVTGCLPVKEGYYSNQTGYISTEFYDITLGISDPNVFLPPKECSGV